LAQLSVNLNKVALLRNSRGSRWPDVAEFALAAVAAGAPSLTVHPRLDGRHIRPDDVRALAGLRPVAAGEVEFNVEGDLREDLLDLVCALRPTQFTVVPVEQQELTSTRGWRARDDGRMLADAMARLRAAGVARISIFCDADPESCALAIDAGADAVELYTGPYADAYAEGAPDAELGRIAAAAALVRHHGLRLHGGHDLTLENLAVLLRRVAFDEVSIGHHLTIEALHRGWSAAVAAFVACAAGEGAAARALAPNRQETAVQP